MSARVNKHTPRSHTDAAMLVLLVGVVGEGVEGGLGRYTSCSHDR